MYAGNIWDVGLPSLKRENHGLLRENSAGRKPQVLTLAQGKQRRFSRFLHEGLEKKKQDKSQKNDKKLLTAFDQQDSIIVNTI
jgi:hypothetical protein